MVFVNIDADEDENIWRSWIKSIREDADSLSVGIGVVTMLGSDEQRNEYLMNLGVNCGFIILKMGAAKTTEILLKTLEANEARGRRKYVRTKCPEDSAQFNCKINNSISRGNIIDLSTVGMATLFTDGPTPPVNTRLTDIQLSLRGSRIITNGIVVGGNDEGLDGPLRVLLFEPSTLNDEKRSKLRSFIRKVSQGLMDNVLITT